MSQIAETLRSAALIVVDVQQGLDEPYWGRRNNPEAESNIARLLAAWRAAEAPIFHIKHNSTNPDSPLRAGLPGNAVKPEAAPLGSEPRIEKSVNSAFIGTDLEQRLREAGIERVVVVGLTTNHCVETTARMAGNLGFTTWVVSDATATHDRTGPDGVLYPAETVHAVSLASLHGEFATVVDTDAIVRAVSR
ncbi:MAG TPA: cysteine hydrolase family protein [Thermomicrobiales bacterium]|nr:cysteine hydrolase family protein [Thermomicrobiales bacterium]